MSQSEYNHVKTLIVGAGPAGLAAAITLKKQQPDCQVCVIDKAASAGHHNLSGAVLEPDCIHDLLDMAVENWAESDTAKDILARKVNCDQVLFMPCRRSKIDISFMIRLAKKFGLGFGQMEHKGDYIVSIAKLTSWLSEIAVGMGIEVLYGFAAEDIIYDAATGRTTGIKLVDQGLDHDGSPQPNYLPGETIEADMVILAEGCDGLLTEKFVEKASLARLTEPLYSVGIKQILKVSDQQYANFGDNRVIHAMGYPLWKPVFGPGMFGGGIAYSMGDNQIAVGMIVGADWKECDFNPQDALEHFKDHPYISQYVEGGMVVEAGAKMIPEGGFYAIPRCGETWDVGCGNVIILGDSANLVNMNKIKGLHNAIKSGMAAGIAAAGKLDSPEGLASEYTAQLEKTGVIADMKSAKNFRQTVAKFGNLIGMPLSVLAGLLPRFKVEKDSHAMKSGRKYKFRSNKEFDKDTFTAMANTCHREDQPSHLKILDAQKCEMCQARFGQPCITFCPAGVYENIHGKLKPANPSNCLHCKTCQRKCPLDNINWTVPEGGGGPKYKSM